MHTRAHAHTGRNTCFRAVPIELAKQENLKAEMEKETKNQPSSSFC